MRTVRRTGENNPTALYQKAVKRLDRLEGTYLEAFDGASNGQQWAAGPVQRHPARSVSIKSKPRNASESDNRVTRAGSSAGQSSGLIIRRTQVRVLPGP